MLSTTKLAFVGVLAIFAQAAFAAGAGHGRSPQTAELAGPLPKSNIESACRDAQSAAPPEQKSASYQSCVRDERLAFEQLRQSWSKVPAAAREVCAEPDSGVPFSYVELQTCLEMQPGGNLTVEGHAPDGLDSVDIGGSLGTPSPAPSLSEPRYFGR
jgi:hypothetical protein